MRSNGGGASREFVIELATTKSNWCLTFSITVPEIIGFGTVWSKETEVKIYLLALAATLLKILADGVLLPLNLPLHHLIFWLDINGHWALRCERQRVGRGGMNRVQVMGIAVISHEVATVEAGQSLLRSGHHRRGQGNSRWVRGGKWMGHKWFLRHSSSWRLFGFLCFILLHWILFSHFFASLRHYASHANIHVYSVIFEGYFKLVTI